MAAILPLWFLVLPVAGLGQIGFEEVRRAPVGEVRRRPVEVLTAHPREGVVDGGLGVDRG